MQQMERLLFEEFRGQQELDSGRRNRLDGGNQLLEKGSTAQKVAAPELEGRSTTKKSCNELQTGSTTSLIRLIDREAGDRLISCLVGGRRPLVLGLGM